MMDPAILRIRDVSALTGLSRISIWRRCKAGTFPAPLQLGGPGSRAVGWRTAEVRAWIDGLTPKQHEEAESRA